MSHEVFISHSSKDKKMADAVCHYLEHERLGCWIAPRDVRPGANFAGEIVEAIPRSKVMLIILSANSNASQQVLRELELAVKNELLVIPIRIEDIIPTGSMSYYMSTMQWIDFFDPKADENLKNLAARIKNILGVMDESGEELHKPDAKKESKKQDTGPEPPRKKPHGKKALVTAITAAVLVIAAGLSLFLLRDRLFAWATEAKGGEAASAIATTATDAVETVESETTETNEDGTDTGISDDYSFILNMEVAVEDDTLRKAIIFALESAGNPVSGNLKVSDMLNLKALIVTEPGEYERISGIGTMQQYCDNSSCYYETTDGIESLQGLEYAKNIQVLAIYSEIAVTDLSPLSGLENLVILSLMASVDEQMELENLDALAGLTNLKTLQISGSAINDFSALGNLENLENLEVNWNLVEDISPVSNLRNVDFLCLDGCRSISNWDSLSESLLIKNVTAIGLSWMDDLISDLSFLAFASSLEHLEIAGSNIRDISALKSLYNLKTLYVSQYTYDRNTDTIDVLTERNCRVVLSD